GSAERRRRRGGDLCQSRAKGPEGSVLFRLASGRKPLDLLSTLCGSARKLPCIAGQCLRHVRAKGTGSKHGRASQDRSLARIAQSNIAEAVPSIVGSLVE